MQKKKVGGLLALSAGLCVAAIALSCYLQDREDAKEFNGKFKFQSRADFDSKEQEVSSHLEDVFRSRGYTTADIKASVKLVMRQMRKQLPELEALVDAAR